MLYLQYTSCKEDDNIFLSNRQKPVCWWDPQTDVFSSSKCEEKRLCYYKSLLHVTSCYVFHFVALNLLVSGSPMWWKHRPARIVTGRKEMNIRNINCSFSVFTSKQHWRESNCRPSWTWAPLWFPRKKPKGFWIINSVFLFFIIKIF